MNQLSQKPLFNYVAYLYVGWRFEDSAVGRNPSVLVRLVRLGWGVGRGVQEGVVQQSRILKF
jgi:hypothetical protein